MTNQKKKGTPPKGSRPTPQRTSPAFVTPMAAQVVKKLPEGDAWIYELKFEGYRATNIRELSAMPANPSERARACFRSVPQRDRGRRNLERAARSPPAAINNERLDGSGTGIRAKLADVN